MSRRRRHASCTLIARTLSARREKSNSPTQGRFRLVRAWIFGPKSCCFRRRAGPTLTYHRERCHLIGWRLSAPDAYIISLWTIRLEVTINALQYFASQENHLQHFLGIRWEGILRALFRAQLSSAIYFKPLLSGYRRPLTNIEHHYYHP